MRDPATRAGYCTAAGMLSFAGLIMVFTGNAPAALIEFTLTGVVFGVGIARARRGHI